MKQIMISIKPEWVEKILRGEKVLEIRKSIPQCVLNGEECIVEIYCTKDPKHLVAPFRFVEGWFYKVYDDKTSYSNGCTSNMGETINGKVVAEFILNKITTHKKNYIDVEDNLCYNFLTEDVKKAGFYIGKDDIETINSLCDFDEFVEKYGQGKPLYAWHIENLHIYDKPKELAEFGLKRPFQSWGYLKDE